MRIGDAGGQSTVEMLLIGVVVVIFALVLGHLWNRLDDGTFTTHISASASHTGGTGIVGGAGDVIFF